MISSTKRRLASLATASAIVATMAVAIAPSAAFAATCTPTGFIRDTFNLTAAQIGGPVTGELNATGCDIGVYNPTSVTNADIHGAKYFGVVANGVSVNTTNSKVHQIGDPEFNGAQHGRAITYINGASGKISGNQVYDFQKNGIEIIELEEDGATPSGDQTSATVEKNVVTGEGPIDYISQNGIVIRNGASATVKNNTFSGFTNLTPGEDATGVLLHLNTGGTFAASANKFAGNDVNIYGANGAISAPGGHIKP